MIAPVDDAREVPDKAVSITPRKEEIHTQQKRADAPAKTWKRFITNANDAALCFSRGDSGEREESASQGARGKNLKFSYVRRRRRRRQ